MPHVHGCDWAAVNVELLSEVLTLVPLKTKILCESVCKTWRKSLRDEPEQGLWGAPCHSCERSHSTLALDGSLQ